VTGESQAGELSEVWPGFCEQSFCLVMVRFFRADPLRHLLGVYHRTEFARLNCESGSVVRFFCQLVAEKLKWGCQEIKGERLRNRTTWVSARRCLSDQHNSHHGHFSFMSDNYQFTSLIRGNLLGLRNDHETEISAIAVNHSNSVIQIRESSAQCDISTYRKSRGERSSSPIPCAALLLGGVVS
jgi:hypothetical protein